MTTLNDLSKIPHSSCKHCVFAEWKSDEKTQIGCKLNLFDKLISNGVNIIEAEDVESKFFVVANRKCPYYRTSEWGKDYLPSDWEDVVKCENKIRYNVIIYVPSTTENSDLSLLKNTISDLLELNNPPGVIAVCDHFSKLSDDIVVNTMEHMVTSRDIKWIFQRINDVEVKKKAQAIELCVRKLGDDFFAVFNVGYRVPYRFFDNISSAIFEELRRFSIILPDKNDNGYVSSGKLYKTILNSVDYKLNVENYAEHSNPLLIYLKRSLKGMKNTVTTYDDFCRRNSVSFF